MSSLAILLLKSAVSLLLLVQANPNADAALRAQAIEIANQAIRVATEQTGNQTSHQSVTTPVITSISPLSGPSGTVVKIRGNNLAGFEGDLIAIFKRSDGKTAELYSTVPYYSGHASDPLNTSLIQVTAEPPCKKGQTVYGSYSGIASTCDYFEFTPGTYTVYVQPWGKKSNEVEFTIK